MKKKVYKFDDLSEKVKEKLYLDYFEWDGYSKEVRRILFGRGRKGKNKSFCEIFDIYIHEFWVHPHEVTGFIVVYEENDFNTAKDVRMYLRDCIEPVLERKFTKSGKLRKCWPIVENDCDMLLIQPVLDYLDNSKDTDEYVRASEILDRGFKKFSEYILTDLKKRFEKYSRQFEYDKDGNIIEP